ncbi:hypothetical protein GPU89_33950 [Burkholderia cepacia]|uniref:hypothetical protein n=1 Tax=Burkholderia cepacia TaxID=292 RepID=UPI000F5E9A20|nr:hypothetical protein [Burkholderia cepacia]NLA20722.1 hypothetical protein [Burkholderia cepacia]RQT40678.1 hypothetical protein DF135_04770 [Burkholderia cepacia]
MDIDAIDGGIRMSRYTRRSVAGRFTLAQSSIYTQPTAPPGIANEDLGSRRIDAARSRRRPKAEYLSWGVGQCRRRGNRGAQDGPDFRRRG